MDDLISRQDAIDMIRNHWSDFSNADNYRTAKDCVDAVPSAQPEIIRCKDCKHYVFMTTVLTAQPIRGCCRIGFEDVDEDDFCSRAERREVTT